MNTPRLVGLSGSLRQGSYNTALLRACAEILGDDAHLDLLDIRLPLYDADLDDPVALERVQALKDAIDAADGLIIASPEYNWSIPGPLKNAIDWVSKPAPSPFRGTPVLFLGATPGATGTARVKMHLRDVFASMGARIHTGPEFNLARAHERFQDGRLTDSETRTFLGRVLDGFVAELG